jgi:adenosylcobinamide-phosphate synthase
VILVCLPACAIPWLILLVAFRIHMVLGIVVMSLLCWQMLAARSLYEESMAVFQNLSVGNTEAARSAVSMIVGRDTDRLDESGIAKAAVETVAENTSDGVIAPLLFMLVFGPCGDVFYKAVNTMDSMIGYKNERYRDFGWAAARLDDVLNLIPSRISAIAMILMADAAGGDRKNAARIWRRDRNKHASPNSAQTESACAGALHIRLGGDAWYSGKLVERGMLGDPDRPVEAQDIFRANRLMFMSSGLVLAVGIVVLLALWIVSLL